MKITILAALALPACNLGDTNVGDLPAATEGNGETESHGDGETETEGHVVGDGSDCDASGWMVHPPLRDGDQTTPDSVLGLDDGFVLGGAPRSGEVTEVDADGNERWSTKLGEPGQAFVKDLLRSADGSLVAAVHDFDLAASSGRKLRVVGLSSDGMVEWDTDLGAAHFMAWMAADVLRHPQGGTVVSWHGSDDGGAGPQLRLARLDDAGQVSWSVGYPVAFDAPVAESWAQGAAAMLGDGSVLQLTSTGVGLRLVRTDAEGGLLSDVELDGIVAWPKDLVTLPDGGVLVLANDGSQPMLLEVSPDGAVLTSHTYSGGDNPFLDAMAWDPTLDVLALVGTSRDDTVGWERPWTLLVDRQGNEIFSWRDDEVSGGVTSALDVSTLPTGGFVVSRLTGALYYETVQPCTPE